MNTYYIAGFPVSDELYHHGIQGQKWGIRRYQNPDGTLTGAGRARYSVKDSSRELGIGNKNTFTRNTVEGILVSEHAGYKNSEDRQYRKAAKAKAKGKDATKYINKAKEFAKSADMIKKMGLKYKDLDEGSRRSMDARVNVTQFVGQFMAGVPGNVIAYNLNKSYLKDRLS